MVSWITAASLVVSALLLLHIFMWIACWCAMSTRFRFTGLDTKTNIRLMARTLMLAIYRNAYTSNGSDYDVLVEMIAAFFLFGYTAGKHGQPESGLEPYVRRYKATRNFHDQLVRLTRSAYHIGKELNDTMQHSGQCLSRNRRA